MVKSRRIGASAQWSPDFAYPPLACENSRNTSHGSGWIVQVRPTTGLGVLSGFLSPSRREGERREKREPRMCPLCRQDLNNPPTARGWYCGSFTQPPSRRVCKNRSRAAPARRLDHHKPTSYEVGMEKEAPRGAARMAATPMAPVVRRGRGGSVLCRPPVHVRDSARPYRSCLPYLRSDACRNNPPAPRRNS